MAAHGPARHRRRARPARRARIPLRHVLLRDRVHPPLNRNDIEEARARWRELAGEDAGLGPIAAFHDQRLAQLLEADAPDVSLDLSADAARDALAAGVPLLQAGTVAVEPGAVLAELRALARNLAETADPGSTGQRAADAIAGSDIDIAPVIGPALDGDRGALAREAERLGVDGETFAQLVALALQPFLWETAAAAARVADIDRWDRGFCPVCGAWPGLAELVGPEKRRVLRCTRCGAGWSWLVLLCPYCGNDDHRSLSALREEKGATRIDVCERCHGYVKAITSYGSVPAPQLVAEDVATLDLDMAAKERGYERPGHVDVAEAGIPRLVREGRALRPPS